MYDCTKHIRLYVAYTLTLTKICSISNQRYAGRHSARTVSVFGLCLLYTVNRCQAVTKLTTGHRPYITYRSCDAVSAYPDHRPTCNTATEHRSYRITE